MQDINLEFFENLNCDPLLIVFWVEGCSICEKTKAAIELLQLNKLIKIYKFKIDVEDKNTKDLISKYNLSTPPSLLILNNKKPFALLEKTSNTRIIDLFVKTSLAEMQKGIKLSLVQRAKSLGRVLSKSIFSKQTFANKTLIDYRNNICNSCVDRNGNKCGLCGCPLKTKQLFTASKCDKNLW